MRVQMIELDLLDSRADARPLDDAKVRALVASIGDVGLINPVRLRPSPGAGREGRFEIVTGMHRVAAYHALGLVEIEADVVDSGDLFAELAMIDENLCRAELTPAQLARQVARRKQIYEDLHPETRHGGDRRSDQVAKLATRSESERFTSDTAHATGRSERSVQRDAERGQRITEEALDAVEGTALDTGAFLDRLKRVEPEHQAEVVAEELERRNPNAHRATMHRRVEPDDSLNYFPTPPWATRALMEVLLIGDLRIVPANCSAWEPACGEGHMSGVLLEYFGHVEASDIFDYSVIGDDGEAQCPPGWIGTQDFVAVAGVEDAVFPDWIITNPPFGALTQAFVLKALSLARDGVAMLVRQQWLEGVSRYRELFAVHPPAVIGQFVERVPIHKGRWDPDGDTLTSYVWIVWDKHTFTRPGDTRFVWIPDGQCEALTRADDIERFTAHPVRPPSLQSSTAARMDVLDNSTEGGTRAEPLDQAAASTPPAGTQAPPVDSDPLNAAIRAGYARNAPIAELVAATGLSRDAVMSRAKRMNIGSRDRQRAAVAKSNRRRGQPAGARQDQPADAAEVAP